MERGSRQRTQSTLTTTGPRWVTEKVVTDRKTLIAAKRVTIVQIRSWPSDRWYQSCGGTLDRSGVTASIISYNLASNFAGDGGLTAMGKHDKTQPKLHFERCKTISQAEEGTESGSERIPEVPTHEDQNLQNILTDMQQSLTQIDGKIDSLSYRMDRMSERLDKQTEQLDQAERRVSAVEDGQTALAAGQLKVNTELGIYGPNYDDPQFYRDLAAQAMKWGDLPQLWCGDFNCTLSPALDRLGG
ncbi:hypothetical protein NDU88_004364 [Pleurodeles waltl]|uniref:Uncharacterized protein n=1 Tax=Pleurodeles waltl TaxID=8319 RepID=A0AAV7W4S6_PLEWA|nr:hypothetical protein NDU88_004364 [Pleurodeles waltl]